MSIMLSHFQKFVKHCLLLLEEILYLLLMGNKLKHCLHVTWGHLYLVRALLVVERMDPGTLHSQIVVIVNLIDDN
jgi:hypothetical protein